MVREQDIVNGDGRFERWVRLPKSGHEPHCGLTRAHIYNLIGAGRIKSACIRQPGKLTGVRVVWLASLMEYVERHVDKEWKRQNLHLGANI